LILYMLIWMITSFSSSIFSSSFFFTFIIIILNLKEWTHIYFHRFIISQLLNGRPRCRCPFSLKLKASFWGPWLYAKSSLNGIPVNVVSLLRWYCLRTKAPHNVVLTRYYVVVHPRVQENGRREEGHAPK
jgi:hypothetical protein